MSAWGGVQGVQTLLSVLFTEGVRKRGLPIEKLVCLLSRNPARLFGLYPRKGSLRVGSDADLTIFDPRERWILRPEDLLHKNPHSPYLGMSFQGKVETTISRGKIVYMGKEGTEGTSEGTSKEGTS
jgi:allantoinase